MSFRCTKKTRDAHSWMGLALSALALLVLSVTFFMRWFSSPVWLVVALFGVFTITFIGSLRLLIIAAELELVVDGGQIRWGRIDRPDAQERLSVAQLVRLVNDRTDSQVLAETGRWPAVHVGGDILIEARDRDALVDYLRQTFPDLKIETI